MTTRRLPYTAYSHLAYMRWRNADTERRTEEFYQRIRKKPRKVMERYLDRLLMGGPIDCMHYLVSTERSIRHAATDRALREIDGENPFYMPTPPQAVKEIFDILGNIVMGK